MGALVLCALVTACGPSALTVEPVVVARTEGNYRLTFTVPKAAWHVSETIVGEATIGIIDGDEAVISGAENVFGFELARVGGPVFRPVWPASCKAHVIRSDRPLSFSIEKSGTIDPLDPNAQFYREFLTDPEIRLPAGEWRITAIAQMHEGAECEGASRLVRLPIDVKVTE